MLIAERRVFSLHWVLPCLALLLTSCASMNQEDCQTADWVRVGEADGARGHDQSRLAEHYKACSKFDIEPDVDRWRDGWARGVRSYCRPQVGFNEGLNGATYRGVCLGLNEDSFVQAYQMGQAIRRAELAIQAAVNEQRRLDSLLQSAKTDEERNQIRHRMRTLDFEISRQRQMRDLLPRPRW